MTIDHQPHVATTGDHPWNSWENQQVDHAATLPTTKPPQIMITKSAESRIEAKEPRCRHADGNAAGFLTRVGACAGGTLPRGPGA